MSSVPKHRCSRCGKRIRKGGACYRLRAELISYFDGHLRYDEKTDLRKTIEELNAAMEEMTQDEIEKQVYEKFEYIVCPACRDEVARFLTAEDQS